MIQRIQFVQPTAAQMARVAREDARVALADDLQKMLHPDQIALVLDIDTVHRIISVLEKPE